MIPDDVINMFCAVDEGPYAPTKPWVRDEHRYATDGRIIIRVPAPGETNTPGKFPPPLLKTDWGEEYEWAPLPDIRLSREECYFPKSGAFCVYYHSDDYLIGESPVHPIYAAMIKSLPGAAVQARPKLNQMIAFKFDGGRGFLMPLVEKCGWRRVSDHMQAGNILQLIRMGAITVEAMPETCPR